MVALEHSAAFRHRTSKPMLLSGSFARVQASLSQPPPRRDAGRAALARAIETAVLPRLLLTRDAGPGTLPAAGADGPAPVAEDVEALFRLLLADDRAGAEARIDGLQQRGVALERIFLDLLAPVARQLGQAWEEDTADFGTVTLGLMRLQHMLRDLAPAFAPPLRARTGYPQGGARRILLAHPPGEQHSFGRDMLAAFFRRAGWRVWDTPPRGAREFAALVRREPFEVVGLSAGSTDRLDAVAGCIRAVRRSALNGQAGIMVGGPLFLAHPDHVALVGADATAADGRQAVLQAERLLALLACRD